MILAGLLTGGYNYYGRHADGVRAAVGLLHDLKVELKQQAPMELHS
jgi:hypothetical protein